MRRLIFMYVQHHSGRYFAEEIREEGYFYLIAKMVETGIIDECLILIESPEEGEVVYGPGLKCKIIRDMANARDLLAPGDVIWCRGGWRSWYGFLKEAREARHWILFYAANTGRTRWDTWHVIFNDLEGRDFVDELGRVNLDFRKPTNPEIFYPMQLERRYDVCIGASHIHDRKGQWRAIKAAIEYKRKYGRNLRCIMPGAERRGMKTREMMTEIRQHKLSVVMPGMLPRSELNRVYNQSKFFVHLGSHGQGDRGPIEAMRCGCPTMIGFPKYHAPWVGSDPNACCTLHDPGDYGAIAAVIRTYLKSDCLGLREYISSCHNDAAGIETVTLPRIRLLFDILGRYPLPSVPALKEGLGL